MIIQHATVEKDDVIISVGFFRTSVIPILLDCGPRYVEAYDPNASVYEKYCIFSKKSGGVFVPVAKAVSSESGTAMLMGKSYDSTIYPRPKSKMRVQGEVTVVSISSVIKQVYTKFGRVDRLLLNCEGAEIPIIKGTPIETIKLCKYIFVQFHNFVPELCVSEKEKEDCLNLLQPFYIVRHVHVGRSEYEFIRN